MKQSLKLSFLLVTVMVASCAWVKLTPEGEKVRVLSMSEVESCKKLGKTTSSLKDKIAGVSRNKEKVEKEMQALARNSAAEMGGDTVVPVSEVQDGRQTFEVYKCVDPQK
ncbi:MAG: hypothetical protein AMJ53_10070 [Gammaproteobacteria bacterium SG8_11]|nr:MAG: hypothetical protein AMJ53_10070 [Gammaproteobacteria bacterium SG8_11]